MIYPTPFQREEAAERWFARGIHRNDKDSEWLLIGRQIEVAGGQERLDLLALDKDAVPWVFEFKRDVAKEDAVGQLLSYGAFVAPQSRGWLSAKFAARRETATLPAAFKDRFGRELPERLSGRVNLVLAAFDFSDRCNRVIRFLELGAGISIGQMSVRCMEKGMQRWLDCEFLKRPLPTLPIEIPLTDASPERYYLLSIKESELCLNWDECRERGLIVLRPEEVQLMHAPSRAAGLFVYLRANGEGNLVGYGVVNRRGRLQAEPAGVVPPATIDGNPANPPARKWEIEVQWHQSHPFSQGVAPKSFRCGDNRLVEITKAEQLSEYQAAMGVSLTNSPCLS